MYDTVNLKLITHEALTCVSQLEDAQEHIDLGTGDSRFDGRFKNLKVILTPEKFWLSGSFPKFSYGENFTALTAQEVKFIIDELSDEFRLPLKNSYITRLDVGVNIILKEPVGKYLFLHGEAPRYRKRVFPENGNIAYEAGQKKIILYDKILEAKKKSFVPEKFKDKNVLREEINYHSRALKNFGLGRVNASQLYNKEFMAFMLDRWRNELSLIQKIDLKKSGVLKVRNVRELQKRGIYALLLLYGGQDKFLEQLRFDRSAGLITPMNYTRLKKKIEQISLMDMASPDKLIQELNVKNDQAVVGYL